VAASSGAIEENGRCGAASGSRDEEKHDPCAADEIVARVRRPMSGSPEIPVLSLPSPPFAIALEVGEADIDELEHASNIAYIKWIQEVAVAHSNAVGFDFAAYRNLGAVFVVRRHEVDYLRPVLRGDVLEVRTWIDSAFAAKCRRATEISRGGVIAAKAMTTWGFIEMATGRPTRIPGQVREAFLRQRP
jgi:acyl-CoA thioester hydrolase